MTNRKQFITTFFCFIFILIFATPSKANSEDKINSIDITVQILENGDAKITEEWQVYNGSSGTEWYKPIDNLNHMGLEDFKVWFDGWEGVNKYYDWIVQNNFNDKMNRFGINYTREDSFELCWGKTKRNTNMAYKIGYTYTNFVQQFPDGNGFNVKFVNDNMNPAPKKVSLTIKPYKGEFNEHNSNIWAFGTSNGSINFEDGEIIFRGKRFRKHNYLTVLVKSNNTTLPATYEGQGTFKDLKNKALEGSDYTIKGSLKEKLMIALGRYDGVPLMFPFIMTIFFILFLSAQGFRKWFRILAVLIYFVAPLALEINMIFIDFPFMITIFVGLAVMKTKIRLPEELKKYDGYNRESILKYYFSDMYTLSENISKIHITRDSVISAIIMDLINKDILEVDDSLKHNVRLRVKNNIHTDDDAENNLIDAIYKDHRNKFANTDKIGKTLFESAKFRNSLFATELPDLKVEEEIEGFSIFTDKAVLNEDYIPMVKDILGMQNFLKDFTLLEEKEIRDITLWQDYLVMATLLNMPDKVIDALERACPQPEVARTRSYWYAPGTIKSIGGVSKSYSSRVRSSGGGGRSSSGGGGGSSGGGSGGGSR